jgi:hypothetical protein
MRKLLRMPPSTPIIALQRVSYDADGTPLRRIGTVQDITEEKTAAARIVRLSRLYAALSKTNEAVMRSTDFNRLCEQACRIAVEEGGMMSSTIRTLDAAGQTLVRVNLLNMTRIAHHHFDYKRDGHSRVYEMRFTSSSAPPPATARPMWGATGTGASRPLTRRDIE